MKRSIIINNQQGGFLLAVLILLFVLLIGILGFFIIKNNEVRLANTKEYNLAVQNANELLFRKYTFLCKKGSLRDWRVGPLTEAYNFDRCRSGSGTAADCVDQVWQLRGSGGAGGAVSLPYAISYTINSAPPYNWQKVPNTLYYTNGLLSGGTANPSFDNCVGLLIENIPVNHVCGREDGSGNPTENSIKSVYGQVKMIKRDTQNESEVILRTDIFGSEKPVIH